MLDKEKARVAFSILQLVNSITFKLPEGSTEGLEQRNMYNKVAHTIKEIINEEVRKEFNL